MFAVIDATMSLLSLFVSRLVSREGDNRRFQFGYWHIEPMVLAFNGGTLMLLCFYAFLNAVDSLLGGGRSLDFDWAIAYSVVVCAVAIGMYAYERRANRRIGSTFVQLDVQSWLMSASITTALLVAFAIAWSLGGTSWDWLTPYADPAVLALLTIVLAFVPVGIVRKALGEILLITRPSSMRMSAASWRTWAPAMASRPARATSPRSAAPRSSRSTSWCRQRCGSTASRRPTPSGARSPTRSAARVRTAGSPSTSPPIRAGCRVLPI